MPEISVVVPVYRGERTLERCVESILAQTFADFELILVEDGSPDASGRLCDALAARDPRIRVLHQPNRGAAAARQAGLLAASGSSVIFPDCDDWLDPDMLSLLRRGMADTGADVVAVGFRKEEEGKPPLPCANAIPPGEYDLRDRRSPEAAAFARRALYTGSFYTPGIVPALWCKLIRRSLLLSLPSLPPDLRMGDDAAVTYPALARASRVAVLVNAFPYHYRVSPASLSNAWDPDYLPRAESLFRALREGLAPCPPMAESLTYYALFILQQGIDRFLFFNRRAPREEKRKMILRFVRALEELFPAPRDGSSPPSLESRFDWSGFSAEDQALLRPFCRRDTDAVISLLAKRRFSATIRSVLRPGRRK